MSIQIYRAGSVTVENGSVNVLGIGTRWLNYVKPGDTFECGGFMSTIAAVIDNNLLQLVGVYALPSAEKQKYSIDVLPIVPTLSDQKAEAKSRINDAAGSAIVAFVPEWKQRNLNARAVELIYIGASNWTTEQATEFAGIQSIWDHVKTIRAESNIATSAVESAADEAEITQAIESFESVIA